ncbi:MAG: DNA polymerase III subunit chi [Hyphomicrobiales bacterium]|nr:DNA polymerase III subunit chi [Hyphomicrobiales bacterium]MDE2017988.1 DNA polymerase III subunit chi [Hyphomicrobiales bacterium]
MTEIWFYHLEGGDRFAAVAALLEKARRRGWRVAVDCGETERIAALDDYLWTFSQDAFLAHGTDSDGDADLQPILIRSGPENRNAAAMRLAIARAALAPALDAAAGDAPYERAILLFDGTDEAELADARAQWRGLKERGLPLAYWRRDGAGWRRVEGA